MVQGTNDDDDILDQHALLPSVTDDPKLWMVKCRAGCERIIVAQLMSKFIHCKQRKVPWGVTSAFCHDIPPRTLSYYTSPCFSNYLVWPAALRPMPLVVGASGSRIDREIPIIQDYFLGLE